MKDRRDEKIKDLEKRILRASRVSREELREIVSAPRLFDKINARIKLARAAERAPENISGARVKLPRWNLRKIGFAFGAFAVTLALAFGAIFLPRTDLSFSHFTKSVAAPEIETPAVPVIDERENPAIAALESRAPVPKIAPKNKTSKSARRVSNTIPARKPRRETSEPEEAFSPLAFAENLEEAKEAGQIVRVELSRSSLLALGVNPPNGDENLKVKTDLLIGTDGVARGIRFVR